MSRAALSLVWLVPLLAAVAACQSSAPYASPARTGAAVGLAAAGAAANRIAGGCLALCTNGTHCNVGTGLCEGPETLLRATATPTPRKKKRRHASEAVSESASYEPGHEYEVPAIDGPDAGCDPHAISDGGAIACEMDGGTF